MAVNFDKIRQKLWQLCRLNEFISLNGVPYENKTEGKQSYQYDIGEVIWSSEEVSPCDDESHIMRVKMQKEEEYIWMGKKHDLWLNVIYADENEEDWYGKNYSSERSSIAFVLIPSDEYVENVPWTSYLWMNPCIVREYKQILSDAESLMLWTKCGRELKDWASWWSSDEGLL